VSDEAQDRKARLGAAESARLVRGIVAPGAAWREIPLLAR
jgi:hypothetical protein